jgi:hypothetical protein
MAPTDEELHWEEVHRLVDGLVEDVAGGHVRTRKAARLSIYESTHVVDGLRVLLRHPKYLALPED